MNGTIVDWALGAAMATVAVVAGRQLLARVTANSAIRLVMAMGMALMTMPDGGLVPGPVLRLGFGVLAVALIARRRHHAVMCGIMALMAGAGATAGMAHTDMVMTMPGAGPSPLLLAAFGYTFVFALVLAWRLPAAEDPSGHSCEIVMLVSTSVMLLPML